MRRLLLSLAVVVLVAIIAIAGFLFIPSPLQKWAAERGASLAVGRQVTFGEPFRMRAWPPVTITAADVRVANADWGKADKLARVDALDAKIDLLAFWRDHRIEIDRLMVTRPQLNLEVGDDGRRNWDFGDADQTAAAVDEPGTLKPIPGFVLGDIRIEGGSVTYDDPARKLNPRIEAIDLAISQAGADQPVKLDGGVTVDGKRATLAGTVTRPQGVAAGERSPIEIELDFPGGSVGFDGTVNTAAPAASGKLQIDLASPRELATWLGQQLPLPDGAMRSFGLNGQLDLTSKRVALEDLSLRVDEASGSGRVAVALAEPVAIEGELATGRVDLTPYLPPVPAAGQPATAKPQAAILTEDWSDAPIPLPLPLPVNVDFRLRAEGVKARQLELGAVNIRLLADRQQASFTIDELRAYGGQLTSNTRVTPGKQPTYALNLQSQGVGLLAAAQALTGKGRFDGKADLGVQLTATGSSQRQLVGTLAGAGKLVLRDGAILGINIGGMLRQIMTLGVSPGATQYQRTDFAEAGGSFTIHNGILRNEDLRLRAPVLRLEGAGTVDLRQRTVDYRIIPQLATTLEGQGAGYEPVLQAGVPFLLQGPFASPSVRFDLNGTLTSAIGSPPDLARVAGDLAQNPQAVQLLRDQFDMLDKLPAPAAGKARDLIQDVIGGGNKASNRSPAKGVPDLGKAAKGLLESFGR